MDQCLFKEGDEAWSMCERADPYWYADRTPQWNDSYEFMIEPIFRMRRNYQSSNPLFMDFM